MLRGIQQLAPRIGILPNPRLGQRVGVDDGMCRSPATTACWALTDKGDSPHVRNSEYHLREQ